MDLAGTPNYKISEDARLDLARIYWRGYEEYGEAQANRYYRAFFQRFIDIANSPLRYQSVNHIREGYRRSVCGIDSIYYRLNGDLVEIMRVLGQQDVEETL